MFKVIYWLLWWEYKTSSKRVTSSLSKTLGGFKIRDRVSSVVCSNYPVLVKKIGVNDVFAESGNPDSLLEKHGLTVENIKNTVMSILK